MRELTLPSNLTREFDFEAILGPIRAKVDLEYVKPNRKSAVPISVERVLKVRTPARPFSPKKPSKLSNVIYPETSNKENNVLSPGLNSLKAKLKKIRNNANVLTPPSKLKSPVDSPNLFCEDSIMLLSPSETGSPVVDISSRSSSLPTPYVRRVLDFDPSSPDEADSVFYEDFSLNGERMIADITINES